MKSVRNQRFSDGRSINRDPRISRPKERPKGARQLLSVQPAQRLTKASRPAVFGQNVELFPGKRRSETETLARALPAWWVHLWSGLVRDPTGKHYKAIGKAIWLYLYLLVGANWRTGMLFRRIATIAGETGFSLRSVSRWLHILRNGGYIETSTDGRSLNITITKWRPISRKWKGETSKKR